MTKDKTDDLTGDLDESGKLFVELQRKEEDVIPELKNHVRPSPIGGITVHHPLVITMYVAPGKFAFANYSYREKKAAVETALEDRDYVSYVLLHELPYDAQALFEVADQIEDDKTYWELLGQLYTDSENPWQYPDEWHKLFNSDRSCRKSMMTDEELEVFDRLPETLTIHRGFAYTNRDGWSWTLDREKAEWFANRFAELGGFPQVVSATVKKEDVVAYFDRREEKEILVSPEYVTVSSVEPLQELEPLGDDALKRLKTDVASTQGTWISNHAEATIGDLSAYLHKALVQCSALAEQGDPEIESFESTPSPLKDYLDDFGEHDGEPFSYRLENLHEDQEVVQELLQAVGPDFKVADLED